MTKPNDENPVLAAIEQLAFDAPSEEVTCGIFRHATKVAIALLDVDKQRELADLWRKLMASDEAGEMRWTDDAESAAKMFTDAMTALPDTVPEKAQYVGSVGVDSAQLLITDPCYIGQWDSDAAFEDVRIYQRTDDPQRTLRYAKDFATFAVPIAAEGGKCMNELLAEGLYTKVETEPDNSYSYNGACQTTLASGSGELIGKNGIPLGVVTNTGYGDGVYPVYIKTNAEGRVVELSIVFIDDEADE